MMCVTRDFGGPFKYACLSHLLGKYKADAHSRKLMSKEPEISNAHKYELHRRSCTLGRQNIRMISTWHSINKRTHPAHTAFKGQGALIRSLRFLTVNLHATTFLF